MSVLPDPVRAAIPLEIRWLWSRLRYREEYAAWQALRRGVTDDGYSLEAYDRLRCIFVHVPKCAGVSVTRALFGNLGGGHLTVRQYQRIFSPREWRGYFRFTVIRNPWDRALSAFRFLSSGGYDEADRRWAETNLRPGEEFAAFVRRWLDPEWARSKFHFMPQSHFLVDHRGNVPLDRVARLESLAGEFPAICAELGVAASLPELNVSREAGAGYREAYDARARAIVGEVYAEDVERFGYAF